MNKIFCFINGGAPGLYSAVAVAEDGTCLAGHASSSDGWARHDLGIGSNWKHEHYDAHYGVGNWELEWVDNPRDHAGMAEALRLNRLQGEAAEKEERAE
ncbi:hypothetical protein ACYCFC_10070 [Stutzerimonas sp. NM35]